MSEDLRAAAERMRSYLSYLADKEARVDAEHPYGVNHWAGGWYFNNEQYRRDGLMLRDAYLAEHPADDSESVTFEWLESIGFYRDGTHIDDPLTCCESAIYLSPDHNDETVWVVFVEVYELGHVKTRGDVRRLLAALGIEVPK